MAKSYVAQRMFRLEAVLQRPLAAKEQAELSRADVNALLACLYVPVDQGLAPDQRKLAELGLEQDAVNGGTWRLRTWS